MNPYLIAVGNALIPGLGYLILRKRQIFGTLVFIGTVAWYAMTFLDPAAAPPFSTTVLGNMLEVIAVIATTIAFGYDAYALAKEQN